jgi:hypothetical protein
VAFWLTTSAVRPEKLTSEKKVERMTPSMVDRFNQVERCRLTL